VTTRARASAPIVMAIMLGPSRRASTKIAKPVKHAASQRRTAPDRSPLSMRQHPRSERRSTAEVARPRSGPLLEKIKAFSKRTSPRPGRSKMAEALPAMRTGNWTACILFAGDRQASRWTRNPVRAASGPCPESQECNLRRSTDRGFFAVSLGHRGRAHRNSQAERRPG